MVSLSPNIGKIAGIPIQLHWTFVALILLAFFLLATSTQGLFFFSLIVLLFVCVLIHELAHSITSQRNGIKVKKIVLLPIGGASIIDLDRVKPNIEFRIAMAGPMTSIVLGLGFGLLVIYLPGGLIKEAVQFLFEINILLGVFNLLPGFPLDGGRVLRSYLQKKRNFLKSTQLTVKASNATVIAIIIGTIAYALLLPNATFLYREFIVFWDIIIALFLYDGAKAELQNAYIKDYTSGMGLKSLITTNYILIDKNTTIQEMYGMILKKGTHIVLQERNGKILALANMSLNKSNPEEKVTENKETEKNFSIDVPKISYSERLSRALEIMRNEERNILAVMKNGKMIGILYGPHIESIISMYMSHMKIAKDNKSNKN